MMNLRVCNCGCGQKIIIRMPYHKWHPIPKFIKGHSIRIYNSTHNRCGDNNPAKRPEVRKKIKEWHKTHHYLMTSLIKEKIRQSVLKLCQDSKHIRNISEGTKLAMQRPEVKKKQKNRVYHKKPDSLKNHETCELCKRSFIIPKSHHRRFCTIRCATLHKNHTQKDHNTDIEILMMKHLQDNDINFISQKLIKDVTITDFFIEPNICLYCDGDYWHNIPKVKKRDEWINRQLESMGFKVIRVLGSQIKKGEYGI